MHIARYLDFLKIIPPHMPLIALSARASLLNKCLVALFSSQKEILASVMLSAFRVSTTIKEISNFDRALPSLKALIKDVTSTTTLHFAVIYTQQ